MDSIPITTKEWDYLELRLLLGAHHFFDAAAVPRGAQTALHMTTVQHNNNTMISTMHANSSSSQLVMHRNNASA